MRWKGFVRLDGVVITPISLSSERRNAVNVTKRQAIAVLF